MLKPLTILFIVFVLISCNKSTVSLDTSNPTPSNNVPVIASQLKFTGNGFAHNGIYPKMYTCDSTGVFPGLQWSNAPASTTNYVVTMHHYPPTYPTEDKHVYIVLYNIPSTISALPDNSKSIGTFGINTVDKKNAYTPPCSQGPGAKVYILTLYALNAAPSISVAAAQVTMDVVMAGIRNKIVDSAVMSVTYSRP
jgi:phosphatidylethanolamine-binding protein (PEBP) family uncharacterized protein